jgi:hypothetical protein
MIMKVTDVRRSSLFSEFPETLAHPELDYMVLFLFNLGGGLGPHGELWPYLVWHL